jgi:hypothetical protein
MEELRELLEQVGHYMPHGYCLKWEPWLLWSYVASDALTSLSYLSDFFALAYFYRARPDVRDSWMIPAYALFIASCGIVHALMVASIFVGIYPTVAFAKVIMMLISVPVAIASWPAAIKLSKAPSLQAYRELETKLNAMEIDNQRLRDRLEE